MPPLSVGGRGEGTAPTSAGAGGSCCRQLVRYLTTVVLVVVAMTT